MIIDNVGYDVQAMVKLSKKQFIDLHLSNDAIAPHRDQEAREKYLEKVYEALCASANPSKADGKADGK
jgi:hypothetical protein